MPLNKKELSSPRMSSVVSLLEVNVVLSSAHLRPEDADILNNPHPSIGDLCTWAEQFTISVSMPESTIADIKEDAGCMTDEFWQLLEYFETISKDKSLAPVQGIRKIVFDADGDVHPLLPVYDW